MMNMEIGAWRSGGGAALRAGLSAAMCIALATGLSACGQATGGDEASNAKSASEQQATYTFTDDLGNEVTVRNPQRVVACMGSFADVWQLAGGTLVGASDDAFADYGIDSESVQSVGDFSSLNLESILACDPDFVIMTGSTSGRGGGTAQTDLKDQLTAAGVPVAYFKVTTFDDYLRMLRTCCDITGRDDLYAENGEAVKQRIDGEVAKAKDAVAGSRVAVLTTYSQGVRVQNSSTQTGAMLTDLGAVNIADENKSLLSDFSMEALLEIDPDYVFVLPMGNDAASAQRAYDEKIESDPAWSSLTAVKEGHVALLDPTLFQYKPNDEWDKAYAALAQCFGA